MTLLLITSGIEEEKYTSAIFFLNCMDFQHVTVKTLVFSNYIQHFKGLHRYVNNPINLLPLYVNL